MTIRHFVAATAGHIDHGKSALVKALTGRDTDRLPEEKLRHITIELGFAHVDLETPAGESLRLGIVDVPGHEDFVRNMIAGVGSIDLALFVVAADDGWMPQTEEHLQILTYLGVTRGVVALTKADLGGVDESVAKIRAHLEDTIFSRAPIIATSARTGAGIADLKSAVAAELSTALPQPDVGRSRLCVDRAFSLRGIGTVVTGTLTGGSFRRGQAVVIQPGDLEARIRSVQSYGRDVDIALPGMRTALNLPDLAAGFSAHAVRRGHTVTNSGLSSTSTLDVLLHRSPRSREKGGAGRPIKSGATIDVHYGTARVSARVVLPAAGILKSGQQAIARLQLESPVLALAGDKFVIRDRSQKYTLAGGVVLDSGAEARAFHSMAQQKFLNQRAAAWNDVDVCLFSEIERSGSILLSSLLPGSQFSSDQIAAALQRLQTRGRIVVRRDLAAIFETWQALRHRATTLIDQTHEKQPERTGLALSELRAAFQDQSPNVFETLVSDLCSDGFVRRGQIMARISHRAMLSSQLEAVAQEIRDRLLAKPLDPPPRKLLALDERAELALDFLINQGTVVEISPELVLLREQFDQMKRAVEDFVSKRGPATVSELRQELQTSRRVIVPLLEHLDREGVTRRIGDQRVLAS